MWVTEKMEREEKKRLADEAREKKQLALEAQPRRRSGRLAVSTYICVGRCCLVLPVDQRFWGSLWRFHCIGFSCLFAWIVLMSCHQALVRQLCART